MSTFAWKAVDAMGSQTSGTIDAETKNAVIDQLRSKGLVVLEVKDKQTSKEITLPGMGGIKSTDLTIMTRQLATMISSGMTIMRALMIIEAQTQNKTLRDALMAITKDVEGGQPLSDSLEKYPKIFSPLYVSMVRAGETGGVLDSSLLRVADQLEAADSLRRQVKSAMMYPLVVFAFAIIVMTAMLVFVVPTFVGIFKDFGGELPKLTQLTMNASEIVKGYWYLIFGSGFGAWIMFKRWRQTDGGRRAWERFTLRIPMKIGDIVQKIALARWSRTLSALTGAGVPLLLALDVTGKTSGNAVIEETMENVIASVKSGGTITGPLRQSTVFPAMVTHMVAVGEETGQMEEMLAKIADFYEDQVDAAVKSLTSIIEPIMIIFIGAIVGFVVISMYLPMFKVYQAIQ
ncbi:MAG: type II secretion system F family protein [Solirubrobacteraceae bacterium]|nr:type II secretion system F family protein [Solirubrobacteraceae bacterium]